MIMRKAILQEALNIAKSKVEKHPEKECYLHFSFVVQENKIIEWGLNNRKIPALHYGYHSRIKDTRFKPKMHAEVNAYWKAKGLLKRNKAFSMINIRLNRMSECRMSKPCSCCYGLLKALGCDIFYYSSNNGFLTIR